MLRLATTTSPVGVMMGMFSQIIPCSTSTTWPGGRMQWTNGGSSSTPCLLVGSTRPHPACAQVRGLPGEYGGASTRLSLNSVWCRARVGGGNVNVRPYSVKPTLPGTPVMEAWMPGPLFHSTLAPAVVWKFPLLPTSDSEPLYSGTASLSFVPLPRICRGPSIRTPGFATAPGPA